MIYRKFGNIKDPPPCYNYSSFSNNLPKEINPEIFSSRVPTTPSLAAVISEDVFGFFQEDRVTIQTAIQEVSAIFLEEYAETKIPCLKEKIKQIGTQKNELNGRYNSFLDLGESSPEETKISDIPKLIQNKYIEEPLLDLYASIGSLQTETIDLAKVEKSKEILASLSDFSYMEDTVNHIKGAITEKLTEAIKRQTAEINTHIDSIKDRLNPQNFYESYQHILSYPIINQYEPFLHAIENIDIEGSSLNDERTRFKESLKNFKTETDKNLLITAKNCIDEIKNEIERPDFLENTKDKLLQIISMRNQISPNQETETELTQLNQAIESLLENFISLKTKEMNEALLEFQKKIESGSLEEQTKEAIKNSLREEKKALAQALRDIFNPNDKISEFERCIEKFKLDINKSILVQADKEVSKLQKRISYPFFTNNADKELDKISSIRDLLSKEKSKTTELVELNTSIDSLKRSIKTIHTLQTACTYSFLAAGTIIIGSIFAGFLRGMKS